MPDDSVQTAKGLERLIEALRVLPGVGPRSAQRMAASEPRPSTAKPPIKGSTVPS